MPVWERLDVYVCGRSDRGKVAAGGESERESRMVRRRSWVTRRSFGVRRKEREPEAKDENRVRGHTRTAAEGGERRGVLRLEDFARHGIHNNKRRR